MKKVLILASVASMIDQFNRNNIKVLIEAGYEVEVACNFKTGGSTTRKRNKQLKSTLTKIGVKFYQVDFSRNIFNVSNHIKSYKIVRKIIIDNEYDFIHMHSPIGGAIGRIAAIQSRRKGTKIIYTAHGFHFYRKGPVKNWLLYYPIEKIMSNYTDVLITINTEDYNLAKNKFGTNVKYIYGVGANTEKYYPKSEKDIIEKRRKLGIPSNEIILLCTGELNRNKNQETIIRAASEVIKKNYNVTLFIAGQGPLRENLIKLVKKLDVEDRVTFLGYRSDLEEYVAISNIVLSASVREGLGMSMVEAMLCRKPIIASKNRGHSELIVHGFNGTLVEAHDYRGFANAIISYINDSNYREKVMFNAYNTAELYTDKSVSEQTRKIYEEL